ncbi:HutD family protein [uncultured Enterovirga sp.]|uniref:HutD/Ves family protein n=1 Tax=uncultured Enterovirga sp. TaxID=2026352 RepID=UPI0035CAADFC
MADDPEVIRASALKPTPWPNGRGVTRDIVRHSLPAGGIDWLVSVADLTEDAPFSHLPGIDRVFTIVSGGPVDLSLGDDPAIRCCLLVPTCFPGDRPTRCVMTGSPSRALNVFVDRVGRSARVMAHAVAAGHAVRTGAAAAAVFCAHGSVDLKRTRLEPGDTLLKVGAAEIRAIDGPAAIVTVEIESLA